MKDVRVRMVNVSEEHGVFTAGLSEGDETSFPDHYYVLLHEDDEHDDCISDPSGSGWDVLEAWGQRGVVLVLKLNEKGRRDFEESDVGDGWRFNLSALAPSRVTQLEGWVARVLANVPRDDALVTAE
jgi:hypothetical protein